MRLEGAGKLSDFMGNRLTELRDKTTASEERVMALERELQVINPDQKTSLASAQLQQLTTQYTTVPDGTGKG